jgi:hypothetical protein
MKSWTITEEQNQRSIAYSKKLRADRDKLKANCRKARARNVEYQRIIHVQRREIRELKMRLERLTKNWIRAEALMTKHRIEVKWLL